MGMWRGGVSGWMWGGQKRVVALGARRAVGQGSGFGVQEKYTAVRHGVYLFRLDVSRRSRWPVQEISVMLDVGSESGVFFWTLLSTHTILVLAPLDLDLRGPRRKDYSLTSPSPTTDTSIACHRGIHPR